jgi:hypothetical protein
MLFSVFVDRPRLAIVIAIVTTIAGTGVDVAQHEIGRTSCVNRGDTRL